MSVHAVTFFMALWFFFSCFQCYFTWILRVCIVLPMIALPLIEWWIRFTVLNWWSCSRQPWQFGAVLYVQYIILSNGKLNINKDIDSRETKESHMTRKLANCHDDFDFVLYRVKKDPKITTHHTTDDMDIFMCCFRILQIKISESFWLLYYVYKVYRRNIW